jgi:hypothetical protein
MSPDPALVAPLWAEQVLPILRERGLAA